MKKEVFTFITLLCSAVSLKIVDDVDNETLEDEIWTWKCNENHCKKTLRIPGERPVGSTTCKLLCDKYATLWPRPTGALTLSDELVRIDPHNIILAAKPNTADDTYGAEVLMEAFETFLELVRAEDKLGIANGKTLKLYLNINQSHIYKYVQGINESYHIMLTTDNQEVNVTISSENFLGARHGLETLSQLIVEDTPSGQLLTSSSIDLTDEPVYTHRGILLDTSRNFITVKSIKRTLDAMAATKLNTFHWHITDSHSFPFYSQTFPNLTKYGAYSKDKVYTEDDIRQIVHYGRVRGIRIVPEFDAPAHVGEGWQWVDGAVVCFAAEPWQQFCVEPPCGQLDPTAEITYKVLQGIYADMARLFDSDHIHMGGDEVNLNCWNSTERIVKEMEKIGLNKSDEGFHALWAKFQSRARTIAANIFGPKARPVLWTSTLTEGNRSTLYLNNSDYIVQIWTKGNDKTISELVNNGFQIILSNYDALYFDCGFSAWVGAGNNWCSPYIPWQTVYENDPRKLLTKLNIPNNLHNLALGSEATLWTEQADDASVDNRLWPRASAMGESLWSGQGSWKDAEHRLLLHRQRLIERGVQADTIKPEWCSKNEGTCYL